MIPNENTLKRILLLVVVLEYLILLVFVLSFKKVSADSFSPTADLNHSQLFFTLALGYDLTPVDKSILYPVETVSGYTQENLSLLSLEELSFRNSSYVRAVTPKDSMVLPPGAEIYAGVYLNNESGHVINIKNAWLFLGQYLRPQLSDIVEIEKVQYRNITYQTGNLLLTKGGDSIELGPMGNLVLGQNAGSTLYTKMYKIGRVSQPIGLDVTHTECKLSADGVVGSSVDLTVKNSGKVTVEITYEGQELGVLQSGEQKDYKSLVLEGRKSSAAVRIKQSDRRCLQRGSGADGFTTPDNYALLLARDDVGAPYWTGSALNIQSMSSGEQLCITRMAYTIPIVLPECVSEPNYVVTLGTPKIEVESGTTNKIPLTITNTGGKDYDTRDLSITVNYPDEWARNIEFVPANTESRVVQKEIMVKRPLEGETKQIGKIVIKAPILFTSELKNAFNVDVSMPNGNVVSVQVAPKVSSQQIIRSVVGICFENKSGVSIIVEVTGNTEMLEMPLPLRINSTSDQILHVQIRESLWYKEIELQTNVANIVTVDKRYSPGTYKFEIIREGPVEGREEIEVADKGNTANINNNCTKSVINPTSVAPIIITPLVSSNGEDGKVLGKKTAGIGVPKTAEVALSITPVDVERRVLSMSNKVENPLNYAFGGIVLFVLICLILVIMLIVLFLGTRPRKS